MPRQSKYGAGITYPPKSAMTVMLIEPAAAMNRAQPQTDLDPHQTVHSTNWLHRDGRMEVRRGLSQSTQTSNPMGVTVTGGMEIVSSTGSFYPLISGTTRFAYHDGLGWSVLSYVSASGNAAPPSGGSRDWYDMTQIYLAAVDDNIAVMACASQQTLFCWRAGSTVFSALSTAPKAKYITAFDNFLMGFNIKDSSGSNYVQRVQWSDRGNPSNWTGALSGFEDLLDAKGQGTRILAQENRVLIFFENEIWQAQRGTFPQTFRFTPLDRTVGTPYGRSVADTPYGTMFLGRDQMLYLLPRDGGAAQAVGQNAQRYMQSIGGSAIVWGVWDGVTNTYQLYCALGQASGIVPTQAFYVVLPEMSINFQSFDLGGGTRNLSHGFAAYRQTGVAGVTWDQATTAGYKWNTITGTWDDYNVQTGLQERALFLGGSTGTMWRTSSTATTDDGGAILTTWYAPSIGGSSPEATKTITEVRIDYESNSATSESRLTLLMVGQNLVQYGQNLYGPTGTGNSIAISTYMADRYPTVYMTGNLPGGSVKINRFWFTVTEGGRSFPASGVGP